MSFFLSLVSYLPAMAQQVTDNQIKAGFIYSFIRYISWEKEDQIDTFRIAVYGEDTLMIDILKSLSKRQAKNKPIRVYAFNSIGQIILTRLPYHLIYITNDKNYFIKDIFDMLKGNNILLVTDSYEYQRYVMINFVYNENGKMQFEINSKNINDAGLKTSPKLVLLGGSEIDIRKLYLETEKSLITEKQKSESYEKELTEKKHEILRINAKLLQLYQEIKENKQEIDELQSKISKQKKELTGLQDQTKEQQENLRLKSIILNDQKNQIMKQDRQLLAQEKEILNKQRQVEDYGNVLNVQKMEINKRQAIITKQEQTLLNQITRIKTQQGFLYLLIALTLMTFSLVIVIYRSNKVKRQKNKELEQMNFELNNSKNEILHQAGQLEIKNIELEKLSIVARETGNAVTIMSGTGKLEWMNEGFTRMYGYTLDEFVSKKGDNLLETSSYENIRQVIDLIASEKRTVSYEAPNCSSDNKKIWIHTTLTPILDEDKNIKKLIAIDSDITQLKEAELSIISKNKEIQRQSEELFEQAKNLKELNKELGLEKNKLEQTLLKLKNTQTQLVESEKMVILGQLTAGIAHEINNPINYINSGIDGLNIAFEQISQLLEKYEEITPENVIPKLEELKAIKSGMDYETLLKDITELARDIKSGVFRTIEIVKELRTFSRLDESDIKYTDLHQNIDSTLVILRNKYTNRIEIRKDYGEIPKVECYPGKINQVLLNILVNAIQAIKDEGKIFIKTESEKIDGIDYALISIRDTGIGMKAEVKKKIFEPFYTTKRAGEGTGLGLSISFSIIENHKGKIEVESQYGKGSTFRIYLPFEFQRKEKNMSIFSES